MIKMLVLDIDGTIMSDDLKISGKIKRYLKLLVQNGIKVVIATGRMYSSAIKITKELEIDTPLICYQGALIKDTKNDKTLYEIPLDENIAREVIEDLKKENVFMNIYINDELLVETETQYIKDYAKSKKVSYRVVNDFNQIEFKKLNKILAIDYNPDKIIELIDKLKQKYSAKLYVVKSTPYYCEICNVKATKGNAVRFLADKWNIKQDEIMAAGDQDNDIEMLLASGVKVAMGNATENLKKVADYITDSVENEGVSKAIKKYINLKDLKWNTESDKDTTSIN